MRRGAFAEGGAVDVILPGQEGAERLDLRLAKSRKFADFQNPVALQFFSGGLVLGVV